MFICFQVFNKLISGTLRGFKYKKTSETCNKKRNRLFAFAQPFS